MTNAEAEIHHFLDSLLLDQVEVKDYIKSSKVVKLNYNPAGNLSVLLSSDRASQPKRLSLLERRQLKMSGLSIKDTPVNEFNVKMSHIQSSQK